MVDTATKLPKRAPDIYGNWATLLLPISNNNEIDWEVLEHEIDVLLAAKLNGIYSNGTAGEFYAQTMTEYKQVQTMLSKACLRHTVPFQIGASFPTLPEMLERIEFAKTLSPTAIQIIIPDCFPLSSKELCMYFSKIQEISDGFRFILYAPPHAKTKLLPRDIRMLMEQFSCLVGLKLAGGDADWYQEMQSCMEELAIFIPGHHLASAVSQGAHGAYSNVSCISPVQAQKWYDLMLRDMHKALIIEKEIRNFMDRKILPFIQSGYSNQACDKALAYMTGWCKGMTSKLRFPYRGIAPKELLNCKKHMHEMLKNFFML